jgi:hypothetical protein
MMVMAVMDAEQSHCAFNVLARGRFVNAFPHRHKFNSLKKGIREEDRVIQTLLVSTKVKAPQHLPHTPAARPAGAE